MYVQVNDYKLSYLKSPLPLKGQEGKAVTQALIDQSPSHPPLTRRDERVARYSAAQKAEWFPISMKITARVTKRMHQNEDVYTSGQGESVITYATNF